MNHLKEAESIDYFVQACKNNTCNNLARKNFSYTSDYNSYYSVIQDYVKQYPIFNNIKIVQLDRSAENGYPHTRPNNIICLPSNARFPSLEVTLFHEAIHIHQRNNVDLWMKFLESEKWFPEEYKVIPTRWAEKIRYNPDTFLQPFWSYENRHIPLPIFIRPHDPIFSEIKVMWYDKETGNLEHEPPSSFVNKYGSDLRQSEHPFEIYAVMMESLGSITEDDIVKYMRSKRNNI